jgi:hypothetical protein
MWLVKPFLGGRAAICHQPSSRVIFTGACLAANKAKAATQVVGVIDCDRAYSTPALTCGSPTGLVTSQKEYLLWGSRGVASAVSLISLARC